jgi:hypothetical protein
MDNNWLSRLTEEFLNDAINRMGCSTCNDYDMPDYVPNDAFADELEENAEEYKDINPLKFDFVVADLLKQKLVKELELLEYLKEHHDKTHFDSAKFDLVRSIYRGEPVECGNCPILNWILELSKGNNV